MGRRFESCRAHQDFKVLSGFRQGSFRAPPDTQSGAVGAALRAFNFSGNFAGGTIWTTFLCAFCQSAETLLAGIAPSRRRPSLLMGTVSRLPSVLSMSILCLPYRLRSLPAEAL